MHDIVAEWKAIRSQIDAVMEGARILSQAYGGGGDRSAMSAVLIYPEMELIRNGLDEFMLRRRERLPVELQDQLRRVLEALQSAPGLRNLDGVVGCATALSVARSTLDRFLLTPEFEAAAAVEGAFAHLQRLLMVDAITRTRWSDAFEEGEVACEKLGAVHLLLHGIWAFKIDAGDQRTDLVLGEPFDLDDDQLRAARGLVLTEWKRVTVASDLQGKCGDARKQLKRYGSEALSPVELRTTRYIPVLSKARLAMPDNFVENGITYRHINIAVAPKTPAKSKV